MGFSAFADDSLAILLSGKNDQEKAEILIMEAKKHQYTNLDKYASFAKEAAAYASAAHDTSRLAIATMLIGYYHFDKSDFKSALDHFLRSLSFSERAKDVKSTANALFSIGNVNYMLDMRKEAIDYYSRAGDIYKDIKDEDGVARVSNTLALIYMDNRSYDSAIVNFNQALSHYDKIGALAEKGQVLTNLSYVYTELQAFDKALNIAEQGKEAAEKAGDILSAAKANVSMAGIFSRKKNWEKATAHYLKAAEIARNADEKSLLRIIYNELYTMYKSKGDFNEALRYYETAVKYKDSIFDIESAGQMAELQTKYETDRKEKEIALLTKDKQRERIIRNATMGGLGLVVLLAFYIYRNFRIKKKANSILSAKNIIIEEKNKNIQDSINYAQRIQQAILPKEEEIRSSFRDAFVLYKPKDVVSGDFYSFAHKDGKTIIAAVDCTGHGVPGAFMSMIGHDQLSHIILERNITEPSQILSHLNRGIKSALKQREGDQGETRDGMDIALCKIDHEKKTLSYAGAHRPLFFMNGSLQKVDADKVAIGGTTDELHSFRQHELSFENGNTVYMFSDGYTDQFGGEKGKKFTTKRFRELLESIQDKPMNEQKIVLEETLEKWKGTLEQIDDVMVIGVRL